jgi:hypothetical protein
VRGKKKWNGGGEGVVAMFRLLLLLAVVIPLRKRKIGQEVEESDSGAVVLGVSAAAGRRGGEFSSVRGGLELVGV